MKRRAVASGARARNPFDATTFSVVLILRPQRVVVRVTYAMHQMRM